VSSLSRDGHALVGFRDSWSRRGRVSFEVLLITSALSLRVPGRSPHPPRPCRSPGGPSRVPTARRLRRPSPRGDGFRIQAPVVFAPLQSFADSPRSNKRPSSHGIRPVRHTRRASLPGVCVVRPPRPFIDMLSGVHSQHDVATAPSAPGQPDQESRSDLVVLHHLAGLLRRLLREERTPFRVRESRACCIPLPIVGFIAFPIRASCRQAARLFTATLPTPRRIPLVHSRTVSPRPDAFLTFTRRAARASRVRVAASAF
jgi:hypothetical protein